jgi:hypothetical protein
MPILHTISSFRTSANMDMANLAKRAVSETTTTASSSTSDQLSLQWTNPSDVLSILLIIGADIVQKALAATSGGPFTPVCFSFGWVAYAFTTLISIIGDGRLLPPPDYPAKVFNLKNGYVRENRSWVIGRLLRDNETRLGKKHPLGGDSLRISVFEALECGTGPGVAGSGRVKFWGIVVMVLQLGIAAIPAGLYSDWGILMITAAGTALALSAGALPQWGVEKLPNQRKSKENFAVTSGNGSRDVMIVLGCGQSLDLEELAAPESPRSTRLWEKHPFLSKPLIGEDGMPKTHSNKVEVKEALVYRGIPVGFWITCVLSTIQCVLWIALLITVAGLRSHSWFLIAVGGLGMFQNAVLAAISRNPEKWNLPLELVDVIQSRKVMDTLMDLEVTYPGFARHLVKEFFPGALHPDEVEWWSGEKGRYDKKRFDEKDRRGHPRSMMPNYASVSSPNLTKDKPLRGTETASPAPNNHTSNTTTQAPKTDPTPRAQTQEVSRANPSSSNPATSTDSPDTPSGTSTAPAPKIPEAKSGISTHDYAAMEPEPIASPPKRKDTENTDSSNSTTLSVDEVYSTIQTPPWPK